MTATRMKGGPSNGPGTKSCPAAAGASVIAGIKYVPLTVCFSLFGVFPLFFPNPCYCSQTLESLDGRAYPYRSSPRRQGLTTHSSSGWPQKLSRTVRNPRFAYVISLHGSKGNSNTLTHLARKASLAKARSLPFCVFSLAFSFCQHEETPR